MSDILEIIKQPRIKTYTCEVHRLVWMVESEPTANGCRCPRDFRNRLKLLASVRALQGHLARIDDKDILELALRDTIARFMESYEPQIILLDMANREKHV